MAKCPIIPNNCEDRCSNYKDGKEACQNKTMEMAGPTCLQACWNFSPVAGQGAKADG